RRPKSIQSSCATWELTWQRRKSCSGGCVSRILTENRGLRGCRRFEEKCRDPALGSGQFADVREVATRDWTQLRRQKRDHGQGLAGKGHKLHLIAFVLTVDVDNCSDIASHQVFRWEILGQDDAIV